MQVDGRGDVPFSFNHLSRMIEAHDIRSTHLCPRQLPRVGQVCAVVLAHRDMAGDMVVIAFATQHPAQQGKRLAGGQFGQQRMPARLKGVPGLLLLAGVLVAAGSGAFIFHNMNVLNPYRTQDDNEARLAAIEKKYLKYEKLPQPAITDIKLDVDLHPAEKRADFPKRLSFL